MPSSSVECKASGAKASGHPAQHTRSKTKTWTKAKVAGQGTASHVIIDRNRTVFVRGRSMMKARRVFSELRRSASAVVYSAECRTIVG